MSAMETDISSLGTHFMWLLGLEGDLGFKTVYTWPFFTVDIRVSILRIHIKLKEILWFPGHISFFFLFLSESELIYCQVLCCLCQIQKKAIFLIPIR